MMGAPSGIWSKDQATCQNFAFAKAQWAEGKSATEIANALTRKTHIAVERGTVIGKLARAGLIGHRVKAPKMVGGISKSSAMADGGLRKAKAPCKPLPPLRAVVGDLVGIVGVPFIERRDSQCAWPLGTDDTASMRCCGRLKVRGSYCADHAEIAYIAVQQPADSTVRKYAAVGRVVIKGDDGEPVPLDIAA